MIKELIRGKAWKYGDNVNTDIIAPPAYMELSVEEASKYAMRPIDPEFSTKFKEGDILVAGNNFGSGSSRETAPLTLRYLGVKIIIAKSFARIFYRNAINLGIIVLESPDADRIEDRDELEINYLEGEIKNFTRNESYKCSKIPEHLMKMIGLGGLVPFLKEYKKEK